MADARTLRPDRGTGITLQTDRHEAQASEERTRRLAWVAGGALLFAALRFAAFAIVVALTGAEWRPGLWASLSTVAIGAVGAAMIGLLRYAPPSREWFPTVAGTFEIVVAYLVGASLMHWQDALTLNSVEAWLLGGGEAPWSLGGGGVAWAGVWVLLYAIVVPLRPGRLLLLGLISISSLVFWPLVSLMIYPMPVGLEPYVEETTLGLIATLVVSSLLCLGMGFVAAKQLRSLSDRLEAEQEMGSYRLVEMLGRGGMGEVWRARHRLLARPAAIKIIRPRNQAGHTVDPTLLVRFEREVQATSQLESPHTIRVYDYGFVGEGTFYYVMELLNGIDLDDLVSEGGPQPAARVVQIWIQALESLAEAHELGLVHRDLKPANLMLCRVGLQHDFVKVLDFGLVKSRQPQAGDAALTREMSFAGTPAYAAPEVARLGADHATASSDLYSLACVVYWLLTGQQPFQANSAVEMLSKHISAAPRPPSQLTTAPVPADLENLLMGCLAKLPQDRPRDATWLAERLRGLPLARIWTERQASEWWSTRTAVGSDSSSGSNAPTAV